MTDLLRADSEPTMSRKRTNAALVATLFALAPLLLAQKGCDALVGYDRAPCDAGRACEEGKFCDFGSAALCGADGRTGVCRPVPGECSEQYEPVCGCDERTYGNACLAHVAGVSVKRDGECRETGAVCGGLNGGQCPVDQFCNFPSDALCGFADSPGNCEPRPAVCDDSAPIAVCGCDGYPYPSACQANAAGISVAGEGECDGGDGDRICGGLTGAACPADQYCDFPADALCGFADATGTCAPIPESCTADDDPACGCNGTTYENACSAHRAGVTVDYEGPCL